MTKPSKSSLVLDGSEVKFRLEAERVESKTPVHIDWVRFTVLRRNQPFVMVEHLGSHPHVSDRQEPKYLEWVGQVRADWSAKVARIEHQKLFADVPDSDFAASVQAYELALEVATSLGDDFKVNSEYKKGHDFYRFRWCIERNSVECGWVGFLTSGDSPRQNSQAQTLHCNLFGSACTFASPGWRDRVADIIQSREATLTRCDLALDFFDGFSGGILAIRDDYNAGLCDVFGKRLRCNFVGDWSDHSKGARSIYFGSKEAGKETNAYEKGDQLFGVDAHSPWLRVELRYGNKLRVLPVDMLRNPASFFAGASKWHSSVLALADLAVVPEKIMCSGRLPLETVAAECVRSLRWLRNTAAASVAAAWDFVEDSTFLEVVTNQRLPGRLRKFSRDQLQAGYLSAFGQSTPEGRPAFVMA